MSFTPVPAITAYPFWNAFTPTLPNFYWDVDSHEERIKRICLEIFKLMEYADYIGESLDVDHTAITELQEAFQKFIDSGYADYYQSVITEWIGDNLDAIVSSLYQKVVTFGLTEDGYFCAYVPDAWSDVTFDTGAVYGRSDYGRLILRYDVDGVGVVDNTYSYTLAQGTDVETLIADLETTTSRGDATYDAVFTNVSEVI